ncbi:MAG: ribulose-phosphate 3-epimerase [Desulfomonile sp.]
MVTEKRILVSPSLLSADFTRLGEEVREVQESGADWLHLDVMDGRFVPNITIGPLVVSAVKRVSTIPLDVHLMIVEPDLYLEQFQTAGADILTVHPEATHHLHRTLTRIRELGMKAGAALNPSTGLESVMHVLAELDVVMLMTVNPGFGGQSFIRSMLPKVRALREIIDQSGYEILIEIDGGVSPGTAPDLAMEGADVFVAGSAVFGHPPYDEVIRKLRCEGLSTHS